MIDRLIHNWALDGLVHEQRYYCSETPFTAETKPAPKAILGADVRTYIDTAIEEGKTYYTAIGAVRNATEKLGVIKQIYTQGAVFIDLSVVNGALVNRGETAWSVVNNVTFVDDYMQFAAASSGINYLMSDTRMTWGQNFKLTVELNRTEYNNGSATFLSSNLNRTGFNGADFQIPGESAVGGWRNRFYIEGAMSTPPSSAVIPSNEWVLLEVTKNGRNIIVKKDGIIISDHTITTDQADIIANESGRLTIGNNIVNASSGQFIGKIKRIKLEIL